MINLEELDTIHAASGLKDLKSYHIVSPNYEHLANLCETDCSGGCVAMTRKEWADSLAAIHNAYPKMAERIRELEDADLKSHDRQVRADYLRFIRQVIISPDVSIKESEIDPEYKEEYDATIMGIQLAMRRRYNNESQRTT